MNEKRLKFLEDYKKVCIKHKMQILGFDDGAFVTELTDEEYGLECLAFEEVRYDDGSVGMKDLSFRSPDDNKNSITAVKSYYSSTAGIKDDLGL